MDAVWGAKDAATSPRSELTMRIHPPNGDTTCNDILVVTLKMDKL